MSSGGRHRMFDGGVGPPLPCCQCCPSVEAAPPPVDLHGYHPYYRQLECLYMMGANTENVQHRGWENCILEMRKEKSRDAARSRRGKENYEFYELAKLLPLPAAITTQLDKASIIRLSISYLKLRDFTQHGDPPWHRDLPPHHHKNKGGSMRSSARGGSTIAMDIFEQHQGTHILQSLDGFAFALSADGRFLYISETVSIYLGLSQVEMTGSSVFDYIHQQDHAELAEQMGINLSSASSTPSSASPGSAASSDDGSSSSVRTSTPNGLDRPLPVMQMNSQTAYKGTDRSFCIRMKSTLTKRGCHFKSSGYRVVLVLSHLRPQYTFSSRSGKPPHGGQGGVSVLGMVAMAIALPPPSINEVRLESDMFVTRLTFEFRVAHCEPRVSDLLDYTAEDLTGKNMYALCHGQDVQRLRKCHIDLIHKGQVMSGYYRLLNRRGGFTWLQTCATVICNSKNSDEQSIICVNYVLSGAEFETCILDCSQMPDSGNLKPDDPSSSASSSPPASADPRGGAPDEGGGSSREGCCTPQPDNDERLVKIRMAAAGESCSVRGESSNGFELEQQQHAKQRLDMSASTRYHHPPQREAPPPKHPHDGGGRTAASSKKRRHVGGDPRKSPPSSPPPRSTPSPHSSSSPDVKMIDRPWKRCSPPSPSVRSTTYNNSMSVKDLEDVMNKHLPPHSTAEDKRQRSTIQWIGGAAPSPPQNATLPASSLLRQIYVNRESVIRSGSGRTAYYEGGGGDGGGGSQEQQYAEAAAQFASAATVSYPGGGGGYMDSAYSAAMTPPASVSPRDKYGIADTAAFSEAAAAAAAAAIPHMHHHHPHYDHPHHLPLKPQVFVHPSSPLDYDQQTGGGAPLYHHASGFHLYHKAAAPTTSASSWYAQPNT